MLQSGSPRMVSLFQVQGYLPERLAYRAQHATLFRVFLELHKRVGVLKGKSPFEADPASRAAIVRRYEALLERELANVRAGHYPRELLFELPLFGYLRTLPELLRNSSDVSRRRAARDFMALPQSEDLSAYPPYYRQTFHWQTDGYLSQRSAELYDLAVEMLFVGTADAMRRQVLPPMSRLVRGAGQGLRLLDIGCGTGRTLLQLGRVYPQMELVGIDLSPYYLELARARLGSRPQLTLIRGPGETLPFRDGHFDLITSTWLMHELPRATRDELLAEARRALRPGGLLIIEDSTQLQDAPDLRFFMERFAQDFHEPYYLDYVQDDLAERVSAAGFRVESAETCFISRVVAARRE